MLYTFYTFFPPKIDYVRQVSAFHEKISIIQSYYGIVSGIKI